MTIKYHTEFEQGSLDWMKARKGMLTASNVTKILTPTLKVANNDKTRAHFYSLLSERVEDFIPENFESWDMRRGKEDEVYARVLYSETYDAVKECGFITRELDGFTLGCSPDGLVGDDGMIEIKSRQPALQVKAIMLDMIEGRVPKDDMLQVQSGLLASGRKWCDYIVYSSGMRMASIRVTPDEAVHDAIKEAGESLETNLIEAISKYKGFVKDFPETTYRPFSDDGGFHAATTKD